MNIYWQEIIQRKERMELDGSFFLAVMRPVEYIETERDNARIKQHDTGCFDTLPELTGEGLLSQALMKQPVNIPKHHSVTLSVLVAERITGWSLLNTKVVEAASYTL